MTKEERRGQILLAAARVFFHHGFEGARIEEIARAAGIGKGTVYEYFISKEQLYEEMVSTFREAYFSKLREIVKPEHTFRENFIAFVRYQTKFTKDHLAKVDPISKSKITARDLAPIVLEMHTVTDKAVNELLARAAENQELRPDLDMEIAKAMVIGVINAYFSKQVILFGFAPDNFDYEKVADNLLEGIGVTAD